MRPAQAAAGCVVPMSAATTAARPARNRRIPASCPAKAGDARMTAGPLEGSRRLPGGLFHWGKRVGDSFTDEGNKRNPSGQVERAGTIARKIKAAPASRDVTQR